MNLADWSVEKWQAAVDVVQSLTIGCGNASTKSVEVVYLNSMCLSIRKDYLHLDDHILEGTITDVFGFFKPKNNRAGGLMNHFADTVLSDIPNIFPNDIMQTFLRLLESES